MMTCDRWPSDCLSKTYRGLAGNRAAMLLLVQMMLVGCSHAPQEPTLEEMLNWLNNDDPTVRYMAVKSLGRHSGELGDALSSLCEALHDKDTNVRVGAAYALADLGLRAEGATPSLIGALKDKSPQVRVAAAYALPAMGSEGLAAVNALKRAARDGHRDVRREAMNALKKLEIAAKYQQEETSSSAKASRR